MCGAGTGCTGAGTQSAKLSSELKIKNAGGAGTDGGLRIGSGSGNLLAGAGAGTDADAGAGAGDGAGMCCNDIIRFSSLLYNLLLILITFQGMEVDGVGGEALVPVPTMAATTTTGVTSCSGGLRMATALALDPDVQKTTASSQRPDLMGREKSSMLISQCSNAKLANRTATILDCTATDNGPAFVTVSASVPRLGKILDPELDDYSKTFHGARFMKNGVNANEVITSSFDPKTLTCLACAIPHKIMGNNVPFTLCLADQNFVPTVCCRGGEVPVPVPMTVPAPASPA
jgi:hypothetical protein